MGSFFGSVHLRKGQTGDPERALGKVAAAQGVNFYMDAASASASWIPVFPDSAGQDFAVSAAIAGRLNTFVVHVLLHDGDVFAYAVYRGTETIDEFSSDPAYFAPATPSVRARLHGHPSRFAELVAPGKSVSDIEAILEGVRREGRKETRLLRDGERLEDVVQAFDRELDALQTKSAPAMARRDERFRARAAELVGETFESASHFVERLAQLKTPAARQLLDDYAAEFQQIVRGFSSPDSIHARLEEPPSAEEAMRAFAEALGLPRALCSYAEIEASALSSGRGAGLRHVPAAG